MIFGVAAIGGFYEQELFVINAGVSKATSIADATSSSFFTYSGGSYPGTGGDCTDELLPLQTCKIVIRFSPTSTTALSEEFTINFSDIATGAKTATLPVEGAGGTPAALAISETDPFEFWHDPDRLYF